VVCRPRALRTVFRSSYSFRMCNGVAKINIP
jgi:hypothetical protein